ncbi:tryptase beta-2-like [Copidosoma floridanum]|uniref:tryptase beta-2-like n=1 Tax=Copidosoma floridanum TaxID=29053 RepID=UPI0006C9AE15|nr:tryptase beta-2-like [Copidosoma floridanum]
MVSFGHCKSYLEVCCLTSNKYTSDDKITFKSRTYKGCGHRNPIGIGFQITGATNDEAQFSEFPWVVAILEKEKFGIPQHCEGSLIHPSVVLTAAHCVYNKAKSHLIVRAGEWVTKMEVEVLPYQDRHVSDLVVHKSYQPDTLINDFALLRLFQPVEITDNVNIVCLPQFDTKLNIQNCVSSGWGGSDILGSKKRHQDILKMVELSIVPQNICENLLRNTWLGKEFQLHDSFICAGSKDDKDTCKGDGGSPLVCPVKNDQQKYYQIGIVTGGIGCGVHQIPGIHTGVSYARFWIHRKMTQWGFDYNKYQYNL